MGRFGWHSRVKPESEELRLVGRVKLQQIGNNQLPVY